MTGAEQWTRLITRVLAPNPGPMTLDGTNSLVIRAPEHTTCLVVDPGPDDEHIETLLTLGPVELVLLTHHHRDHTESTVRFATLTGAPVRAIDPSLCIGASPLADGERIDAAGVGIDVVASPGHTADSVCFSLPDDVAAGLAPGSMLTGDTILGRGTTVIAQPDGSLADYFRTLDRLTEYGSVAAVPGHGPMLPNLEEACQRYTAHRRDRLASIRAALRDLRLAPSGDPDTVTAVVDAVYRSVAPDMRFAAEASTLAHLEYLARQID